MLAQGLQEHCKWTSLYKNPIYNRLLCTVCSLFLGTFKTQKVVLTAFLELNQLAKTLPCVSFHVHKNAFHIYLFFVANLQPSISKDKLSSQ